MNHLEEIDSFSEIFKSNIPLLDVRAPIEFKEGSFPHAYNYPIMSDSERNQIGICYKEHGQNSAISLGHELVSGKTKAQRIDQWSKFVKNYPNGALFCFRGGLRSKISQEWIYEHSGVSYPRIKGGYKALRTFLLSEMERISSKMNFLVIGGQTGCGKTILLNKFDNSLDLEGYANHRGSAFGNNVTPQPKQIDFENHLIVDLIKKEIIKIKVGDPRNIKTDVGPLIRPSEVKRIDKIVKKSVKEGAELVCGGKAKNKTTYECTVIKNPKEDSEISTHEIFGPVLCVYSYNNIDNAINKANNDKYAFQASVFTKNIDTAMLCYEKLDAKSVFINEQTAFRVDWMPFGGIKHSGEGEGGIEYSFSDLLYDKLMIINSDKITF